MKPETETTTELSFIPPDLYLRKFNCKLGVGSMSVTQSCRTRTLSRFIVGVVVSVTLT